MILYNIKRNAYSTKAALFLLITFCTLGIYSIVQYHFLPKSPAFDSYLTFFLLSENLIMYFYPFICIFIVIRPIISTLEFDQVLTRKTNYIVVLKESILSAVVLSVFLTVFLFFTFSIFGVACFGFRNIGNVDNSIIKLLNDAGLEVIFLIRLFLNYILYFVCLTLLAFVLRNWVKSIGLLYMIIYAINLIVFNIAFMKITILKTFSIIYLFTGGIDSYSQFKITSLFWKPPLIFLFYCIFLFIILILSTKQIELNMKIWKYSISKASISTSVDKIKLSSVLMLVLCQWGLLRIWELREKEFGGFTSAYIKIGHGMAENMLLLGVFIFTSLYIISKIENELNNMLPILLPRYRNNSLWLKSIFVYCIRTSVFLSMGLVVTIVIYNISSGHSIAIISLAVIWIKLLIGFGISNLLFLLFNILFPDSTRALIWTITLIEVEILISGLTGKIINIIPLSVLYIKDFTIQNVTIIMAQSVVLLFMLFFVNAKYIREEMKWNIISK